jgi:hypothetical protein
MNGLVLGIIVLFLLWFFVFRNKKASKVQVVEQHKSVPNHGKYHCVTVQFGQSPCDAVKKLEGKRILSSEASVLPLDSCDALQCECRFQHHEERRADDRRGAYNKALNDITESTMTMRPRAKKGRRKSD